MPKAWHLSRGNEKHGPISDRELLLLAELGQLRDDDLLWRPGFDGWRTANSLPGVLNPPPLPNGARTAFRLRLDKIYRWLDGRVGEALAIADDWSKSIQLWVRDVYSHIKQAKFDRGTFASRVQYPQLLAGLLFAVVGVCALDMARHSSFATSSEAALKDSGSPELASTTLNSTAADAVILLPSEQPLLETTASDQPIHDDAGASSVIDPQPSHEIVSVGDSSSVVPSNSVLLEPSTPIPLPVKKPAKPINSMSTAQAPRPKPMRFGTIGFNYSDQ
jgi:hypothetical protein